MSDPALPPAPSRRGIVIAILLGLPLLALAAFLLIPGRGPRHPNIILIVWDTCRADRLSVSGYDRPTTPFLEEFAKEAVNFRRAYTPAPWTAPAHASLFTGLLPSRHGLTQIVGSEARVLPGIPLLAETLSKAGYDATGFTSNAFISGMTGLDLGFSKMVPLHRGPSGKGTGARMLEEMRTWLAHRRGNAEVRDRPLFLFANLMEPHVPRDPPPGALGPVRDPDLGEEDLAAARAITDEQALFHTLGIRTAGPGVLAANSTLYDGACREADGVTRELFDLLRAEGLLEGAVVAITSDHGEALGEHGELGHRMSVGDKLLHIPLLLRWPGRMEGGRTVDEQVRLQDLYPTLLEAAGVEAPRGTGLDALSLTETPLRPRPLVSEFHRPPMTLDLLRRILPGAKEEAFERFFQSLTAVQDPVGSPGARKYVRVMRRVEDGPESLLAEHLYDLAADPAEEKDLLAPGGPPGERAAAERLRRMVEPGR